mmetsp:Transcript_22436/g.63088  ORF Transcript_22436/g.63088 Transcript_22436/m.63088 type:complete len:679 (+) Transcript_22436:29-2065(+)
MRSHFAAWLLVQSVGGAAWQCPRGAPCLLTGQTWPQFVRKARVTAVGDAHGHSHVASARPRKMLRRSEAGEGRAPGLALAEGSSVGTAAPAPTGVRVFAVPTPRFCRSVASSCTDFEVAVRPQDAEIFGDYSSGYISGFFFSEPHSDVLGFEGILVADDGAETVDDLERYFRSDDVSRNLHFTVTRALGPWLERIGWEPWLQRLHLLQDPSSVPRTQRLEVGGLGLFLDRGAVIGPTLSFSLDTGSAYYWMRYNGYLRWAEYIIEAVREASPPSDALLVDLGGGSGWMSALLKAHLGSTCDVVCTDIAEEALELARENFARNGVSVATVQGDMVEPIRQRGQLPNFFFFYPPQDSTALNTSPSPSATSDGAALRGSPDVALLTPEGDATHFHRRFCQEADIAPDGIAWLAVDWGLLSAVVDICCGAGWRVEMPEAVRGMTNSPSTLLELRRPGPSAENADAMAECVATAMQGVEDSTEYQNRAIGTRSDAERAERYRISAERGNPAGQLNLGSALISGQGVPRDEDAAAENFYKAAMGGQVEAQVNLGKLLMGVGKRDDDESGFPRNNRAAAEFLRMAAMQGHEKAQALLVSLYADGHVDPSSDMEAARWIRRMAERADADAQVLLVKMLLQGQGMEKDTSEALLWLRRAAALKSKSGEQAMADGLMNMVLHLEGAGG